MESFEACTQTVGSGASTSLFGNLSLGGKPLKLLVRTASNGMYVGNSAVSSAATGYELVPNKEYEFTLRPMPGNTSSAAHSLNVWNGSGSSATISWIASPAE